MNPVFTSLLDERIERFEHSFLKSRSTFVEPDSGVLRHPGEFGILRESIFRDFLRLCIPARFEIGQGFLINSVGDVSTQLDVVVYDGQSIPLIESQEYQRFYPVEGVCVIGEVKSVLSKAGLSVALNKMARAKQKADNLSSTIPLYRDVSVINKAFDRRQVWYDQLISFLVCERFDFDIELCIDELSSYYDDDILDHHKHNMILSISDGLLLYMDRDDRPWMYPPTIEHPALNTLIKIGDSTKSHFYTFCTYMYMGSLSTTILYPEMSAYMPDNRLSAFIADK